MTLDEIMKLVEEPVTEVKKMMDDIVSKIEEPTTRKWMEYFLLDKGHSIRPALIFLSYYSLKENTEKDELEDLKKMAVAFEFLHTASLIHDDILDDEEQRRGKRTINKAFSNKAAMLVGNVFYLEAFRLAAELPNLIYFRSMIDTSENMCFGEIIQLEVGSSFLEIERYMEIIEKKTARLISMCMREGARFAVGTPSIINRMGEIGLLVGILYQLRDDIKDKDAKVKSNQILRQLIDKCYMEFCDFTSQMNKDNIYKKAIFNLGNVFMNNQIPINYLEDNVKGVKNII